MVVGAGRVAPLVARMERFFRATFLVFGTLELIHRDATADRAGRQIPRQGVVRHLADAFANRRQRHRYMPGSVTLIANRRRRLVVSSFGLLPDGRRVGDRASDFIPAVLRVGAELPPLMDQHSTEGRYVRHVSILLLVIAMAPDAGQRRVGRSSSRAVNGHVRRTIRNVMDGTVSLWVDGRRRSRNGRLVVGHSADSGRTGTRNFNESVALLLLLLELELLFHRRMLMLARPLVLVVTMVKARR